MRPLWKIRDMIEDWVTPAPVVPVKPTLAESIRRGTGWCIWTCIAWLLRMFAYFLKP